MDGRLPHAAQWEAAKHWSPSSTASTAADIGICSCSSEAYNLAAAFN